MPMGNVFFYLFHIGTHTCACHGLSKNLVWIDTDCQSRAIIQKTLNATMPPTATAWPTKAQARVQGSHPHQLHQMQQWSQKMTEDEAVESWMSTISPHPPKSPQSARHCRTSPSLRSMPRALLLKGWKNRILQDTSMTYQSIVEFICSNHVHFKETLVKSKKI